MTQITDESFLTAFNQIVKDLRSRTRPLATDGTDCRPRNFIGRRVRTEPYCDQKTGILKKSQTGRSFSAPYGGPYRVLLPFLTRGSPYLYHHAPRPATTQIGTSSNFGDLIRIPNGPKARKGKLRGHEPSSARHPHLLPLAIDNARLIYVNTVTGQAKNISAQAGFCPKPLRSGWC